MNTDHFFEEEHLLENSRARLEPLQVKHYALLLPIAMEKELWQFTSNIINNEADFKRYFNTAIAERKAGLAYPFAVYDKQTGQYAGSTRYGNISFVHKKAEIGWTWYHPNLQGTGLNKACKSLLLNFGFDTLQLNRIELKTSALNLKSQAAMLKTGAVKEGIFRNHIINENGTVRDSVYFSFIKEEWPATKERYKL
jgi:RimJ/RimL family protein N-acetyltransferase